MSSSSLNASKEVKSLVTYLQDAKYARFALSRLLALENIPLDMLQEHEVKAAVWSHQFEGDSREIARKIVHRIEKMERKSGLSAENQKFGVENVADVAEKENQLSNAIPENPHPYKKRAKMEVPIGAPEPKKVRLGSEEHFNIALRQKTGEELLEFANNIPAYQYKLENIFQQKLKEDFARAAVYPKPPNTTWKSHYETLLNLQKKADEHQALTQEEKALEKQKKAQEREGKSQQVKLAKEAKRREQRRREIIRKAAKH